MKCSNPNCPKPHIVESEQGLICDTCGAVAQEESGLVSEQGFGETESGRITALGVHIGESQTHQRTYAPGGALGNAGREPTINRDRSEAQARAVMLSYQSLLGVRPAEVDAGMQIFKLAWGNSFVQGRTIDSVAVVCLYLACRRKHEQFRNERRPMYSLMLIDFAEKLNMDVFALGKMYSDLVRKLYLQPDGSIQGEVSSDLLAMGPEVLVNRFVDELEFDREHRDKIKMDAIRIVQRMKRDWMSTGRRPSGVCGAAVILAARMNNYRRTTREVVLTAKVTEITINKRLEEFQDTASSKLSVTQFRSNEVLDALSSADPPSYQRAHNPKKKNKKQGRPRKHPLPEPGRDTEGEDATPEPGDAPGTDTQQPPAKRARIDADGYKIPDIPARQPPLDPPRSSLESEGTPSSSEDEEGVTPRARGQPSRTRWRAPPASPAELVIENEIEQDVLEALRENSALDPNHQVEPDQPDQPAVLDPPAENDPVAHYNIPASPGKKVAGPAVNTNDGNLGNVSLSPTLRAAEFDSDEDVSTCLLSEEETRIKERVWVSMNADWLRQDHAKRIKRELKEADMRARGLDPVKEALKQTQAKGKRKDGTKRPGRRGDVSYLHDRDGEREKGGDGAGIGEDGTPLTRADRERSAAESVRKMFKTRGVYSRRVNYDVLDSIYGMASGDSAESRSASRSRSQSLAGDTQLPGSRESSVAASVSGPILGGIFRGNGKIGSSRRRSRASLAAEKREKKRKDQRMARDGEQSSGVTGDNEDAERSASRSRSPKRSVAETTPGLESGGAAATQSQPVPPVSSSTSPPLPAGIPAVSSSSNIQDDRATKHVNDGTNQDERVPPRDQDPSDDDEGEGRASDDGDGDDDGDDNDGEDDDEADEGDADEGDAGGDEDVDAAFEGRYERRKW